MLATITQFLEGVQELKWRRAVQSVVAPIGDRYSSHGLNSPGLAIKAGGSALAKTGASDFYAIATGTIVKITAATDLPALTGITITATFFNVVCFFVDAAAVVTISAGTQGATLAAVKWPQFPVGKALVGYLLITYASTFTGGTTPLDTATTVYFNPVGPFDPTVLV